MFIDKEFFPIFNVIYIIQKINIIIKTFLLRN